MKFPSPTETFHRDTYPAINPTLPNLSTAGKNVVITGGGRGVGLSISRSFAKSGASSISILGRRENTLLEAKSALAKEYPNTKVYAYVADVVDRVSLDEAFAAIKTAVGGVDILIANAGYLPEVVNVEKSQAEDWWTGFEVNVKGNFNLIQAFGPVAATHASIIAISAAVTEFQYLPGRSSYHTSKLAAAKFFEYVHSEHPDWFVLNVHPGVLKTAMLAKSEASGLQVPADEIELPADFAVWAVSPDAKFLNGKKVWASWDVDELKAMEKDIVGTPKFTFGLLGWP